MKSRKTLLLGLANGGDYEIGIGSFVTVVSIVYGQTLAVSCFSMDDLTIAVTKGERKWYICVRNRLVSTRYTL